MSLVGLVLCTASAHAEPPAAPALRALPAQAADVPWPTTAWPTGPLPAGVSAEQLEAALTVVATPHLSVRGSLYLPYRWQKSTSPCKLGRALR